MLSVVIATHEDERGLLPTLAALVPGAAAGLVREVIVAAGSDEATAQIADVAGCRLIKADAASRGARLKLAADAARADWLMFLLPGLIPDAAWIDEARRFVEHAELRGRKAPLAAGFRQGAGGCGRPAAAGAWRAAACRRLDCEDLLRRGWRSSRPERTGARFRAPPRPPASRPVTVRRLLDRLRIIDIVK
jgi:hypothetical protein